MTVVGCQHPNCVVCYDSIKGPCPFCDIVERAEILMATIKQAEDKTKTGKENDETAKYQNRSTI